MKREDLDAPGLGGFICGTVFFRLLWAAFGLLLLLGPVDSLLQRAGLGALYFEALNILEVSLASCSRMLFGLTVTKGLVAAFSSLEINLLFAQATLGALLSGVGEVVDTLFRFFLGSTAILVLQVGLLKVLQLIGIKALLGGGAFLLAFAPSSHSGIAKLARLGLLSGVVLCMLFPLLIVSGGKALERHQITAAIESAENLGVLKEQFSDINIRDLARAEGISLARDTLQTSSQIVWSGMLALFISYAMMFVILPLLSLGGCFIVVRYAMQSEGFLSQVSSADQAFIKAGGWIRGVSKKERQQELIVKEAAL